MITLKDIITLGNMGYTRQEIAQLLQADKSTMPPTPQALAVSQPAPSTTVQEQVPAPVPTTAPAQPDYSALIAGLSAKIDALATPQAGAVGNVPPVTSIEDIISRPIVPPVPQGDTINFNTTK